MKARGQRVSTLSYSSPSPLLPAGDYIGYNIFLILVNFLIYSFVFKVTLCGLIILFGSSGRAIFLLAWVSNQGACFTKTELEMHTKPTARWYWEIQNFTHLHCISVAFWQGDFGVEVTLSLNLGFTIRVFLLNMSFDWYKENRHHNAFVSICFFVVSLFSLSNFHCFLNLPQCSPVILMPGIAVSYDCTLELYSWA